MSILESGNKLSTELQVVLSDYGIMREKAIKGSKGYGKDGPAFFGIKHVKDDYELKFTDDLQAIEDDEMELAVIAPDYETFDMLTTKDFSKKMGMKNPTELRAYLRKLLDNV